MIQDTLITGYLTELKIQEFFLRYGFHVSIPTINVAKYDMIVDVGDKLLRIQIKKSKQYANGSFRFNTCHVNPTNGARTLYSKRDIDYFSTIWNDKIYLVPVEDVTTTSGFTIRYESSASQPNIPVNGDKYLAENLFKQYIWIDDRQYYASDTPSKRKNVHCPICGTTICNNSTYCVKCHNSLFREVKNRPSREELKKLIREKSFVQIGKDYGVSDNAVRKWCKTENLPFKKQDINNFDEGEWDKI